MTDLVVNSNRGERLFMHCGIRWINGILPVLAAATGLAAQAADVKVTMHKVTPDGVGESVGSIEFRDSSDFGLLIIPKLPMNTLLKGIWWQWFLTAPQF